MMMLTILVSVPSTVINAQETTGFNQRLYDAYVEGRILDWEYMIPEMRAAYAQDKRPELLYALCFAEYGYIGHCIGHELDDKAKECIKDAIKDVKELEKIYHERHDVLALEGAFYGFQIMLSKFTALYLAPRTFKLINTASASSDRYFNCSMEIGNMRYFTPEFLGGSKKEAIDYYENAVKLAGRNIHLKEPSWIYINTMLLLANAYYDTGSVNRACEVYQKILEYEPEAAWIRKEMVERCR